MILVKYIDILDVSCTIDEILGLAKVSRLAEISTGSNQAQRSVKMSAGVVVELGALGFRPVFRVFCSRVRYLLSNLMSHVC